MKKIISKIFEKIESNCDCTRIIFPEDNNRVKEAKKKLKKMGFKVQDINNFNLKKTDFCEQIAKLKFTKNWPEKKVKEFSENPLNYSLGLIKNNLADVLIAGSNYTTADVARSSLRIIGLSSNTKCLSSSFLMIPEFDKNDSRVFSFADCAIVPEPSETQLADIAKDTAISHNFLTGHNPRVAFLSFSTNSSANHYRVKKVKKALEIFKNKYTDIDVESTEVQFDSATVPEVAIKKYPDSILKGDANVLIYPNLDAGNIAYKIMQRFGSYSAIGPLLQGLNAPIHDLSRGCSIDDIVDIAIIGSAQAINNANV